MNHLPEDFTKEEMKAIVKKCIDASCIVEEEPLVQGTQTDMVNKPSHYVKAGMECKDVIDVVVTGYDAGVAYYIGCAVKYLFRAPFKGNMAQDLKKARHYIDFALEKVEKHADV